MFGHEGILRLLLREPSNEITKLPFMKMSGICLCKCHCAVTTHATRFFTCANKFMKLAECKRHIFCLFRAHFNFKMYTTAVVMKEDEFCWAGKSSYIKISGQYGICPCTRVVACLLRWVNMKVVEEITGKHYNMGGKAAM